MKKIVLLVTVLATVLSLKTRAQCNEVPRRITIDVPTSLGLTDSERMKFCWILKKSYGYTNQKFVESKKYTDKKFNASTEYTDKKFEESESYTDEKVNELDEKFENFKSCINSQIGAQGNHISANDDSIKNFKQKFLETNDKNQELLNQQMRTINSLRASKERTNRTLLWCGGTTAGILMGLIIHNNQQWFSGQAH